MRFAPMTTTVHCSDHSRHAARGGLRKGDGNHIARQETIPEAGRLRVYVVLGRLLDGRDETH